MKIKVAELEGAKLDYWVAKAEGKKIKIIPCGLHPYDDKETELFFQITDNGYLYPGCFDPNFEIEYTPSSDWSQGGPIIEREKITICPAFPQGWSATIDDERWEDDCATPLIAAMRCFVASKFGEEVEE